MTNSRLAGRLLFWPEARIPEAVGFHVMNLHCLPALMDASSALLVLLSGHYHSARSSLGLGIFQSLNKSGMGVEYLD